MQLLQDFAFLEFFRLNFHSNYGISLFLSTTTVWTKFHIFFAQNHQQSQAATCFSYIASAWSDNIRNEI